MVKPAYLALGGVIAAAVAWWYLRGKPKPADSGQKPMAIDITLPNQTSGGSSSDFLTQLLNTANLLPIETVLPNSPGPSTAVAPAVVAPAASSVVPTPIGLPPAPPAGDKNHYAGNPMFDPVVQAYSSDFAAHNANGGGFSFVTAVGGLEGYRAGNRA